QGDAGTLLSLIGPAFKLSGPEGARLRMTDRRSLMKVLAGAALFAVARRAAAEKEKSFTIAYLALLPGEDRNFVPKFLGRLGELGYVEGQNLHFVYRSAEGRPELLPGLASDLVRMKPDVLVTGFGTVAAKTGKAASDGVAVVFMAVGDPVGAASSKVSPAPVATSPDCRTLRPACKAAGFSWCRRWPRQARCL